MKKVLVLLMISLLLAGCVTRMELREIPSATSFFEPLSALDIPDDVKIVAFGEASHGNHEFKALANDVFKYLVLEKGFRAFAIEMPFGNDLAINEYILYGTGSARSAVSQNGFWVHNFQEVVDVVEWMREYNLTVAEGEELRFYGYDIQEIDVSKRRYLAENLYLNIWIVHVKTSTKR